MGRGGAEVPGAAGRGAEGSTCPLGQGLGGRWRPCGDENDVCCWVWRGVTRQKERALRRTKGKRRRRKRFGPVGGLMARVVISESSFRRRALGRRGSQYPPPPLATGPSARARPMAHGPRRCRTGTPTGPGKDRRKGLERHRRQIPRLDQAGRVRSSSGRI